MENVLTQRNFILFILDDITREQFGDLLLHANEGQIKVLKEIVVNLLHGNLNLCAEQIDDLRVFKNILRDIRDTPQINLQKELYDILYIVKPQLLQLFER